MFSKALLLLKLLIAILMIVVAAGSVFAESDTQNKVKIVTLPHTDGFGLYAKPEPLPVTVSKALYEKSLQSCEQGCVTPFGEILGSADGAVAFSNCQSICVKPEYSFLNLTSAEITVHNKSPEDDNLHYIGVIYQCVEYARKWWMLNKGVTFGSIDSAFEIIYLTEGKDIKSNKTFPLARSLNGSAKRPPERGDLVIYGPDLDNPVWRHGHVAVVVDVDLVNGSISLAEENYDNRHWQQPEKFARKIHLFEVAGRYTLIDVDINSHQNNSGAAISGWIYPLQE